MNSFSLRAASFLKRSIDLQHWYTDLQFSECLLSSSYPIFKQPYIGNVMIVLILWGRKMKSANLLAHLSSTKSVLLFKKLKQPTLSTFKCLIK